MLDSPYYINRFAQFVDELIEQRFNASVSVSQSLYLRYSLTALLCFELIQSISMLNGHVSSLSLLGSGFMIVYLVWAIWQGYSRLSSQQSIIIVFILKLICANGYLVIGDDGPGPAQFITLIIPLFLLMPLRFITATWIVISYLILLFIFWLLHGINAQQFIYPLILITGLMPMFLFANWSQAQHKRHLFALNDKLEQEHQITNMYLQHQKVTSSIIFHEVLNPLYSIQGLASSSDKTKQLAEHAIQIIKIWSKEDQQWGDKQVLVDINDLMQQVIARFSDLEHKISFTERHPAEQVYFDPKVLSLVLYNVLLNALTHGQSSKPVCIKIRRFASVIKIRVRDYGNGIAFEEDDEVFIKNKTSKHEHTAGLGLYVCKKMMLQLGGDIEVYSERNKGSAFYICIPLQS